MDVFVGNKKYNFSRITDFYLFLKSEKNNINSIIVDKDTDEYKLLEFYKSYIKIKSDCEKSLEEYNDTFLIDKDNSEVVYSLKELIRMNSGGKFIRAFLIALGFLSKSSDKPNDYYLPLSSAYELFQTSILIHDDIIDNASQRRGKTTIPNSYINEFKKINTKKSNFDNKSSHIANSLGICIGDLGFYLTNQIILKNYKNDQNLYKILSLYNKIVVNTIKGEIIDVVLPFKSEFDNSFITKENDIMEIYMLKTAWYSVIGPFLLGMSLNNYSDYELNKMEEILMLLGIGFQVKDDILGIFGDENNLGKTCSDISEYKQTILYSYVSEKKKEYFDELRKVYGDPDINEEKIKKVKDIFIKSGALDYANDVLKNMFKNAKSKLNDIDFIDEKYKNILYGFIIYLDLRDN